jgi:YegS/Rv2252/BmrU family lipid kinase
MKKALFLINPVSGKLIGQSLKDCIVSELSGVLDRGSFDIEYSEKDIEKQCNNYLSNYEIVVVAGGDGTISQVVKIITRLEKKPKLGIIPIGTGNDLANSLGILHLYKSQGLGALLKMILRCNVAIMDILSLDNNFIFTNYLGIGSDAKISVDFNRLRHKPVFRKICRCISNKAFYGLLVLKNIFYRIPFDIEISYQNEHSKNESITINNGLCEILISNTNIYAGGVELSSKCRMDDGKFEVTVIRGTWEWIHLFFALLFKKPLDTITRNIVQFQTDKLELNFTGDSFYQVDGEKYDGFSKREKMVFVHVESSCEVIVP